MQGVRSLLVSLILLYAGTLKVFGRIRSAMSIRNDAFNDRKILEREISLTLTRSLIECGYICGAKDLCLSYGHNEITQTCVLYDKDFTDIGSTQIEDGWFYFHVIRDFEQYNGHCTGPYISSVCSLFCLHYEHIYPTTYNELKTICESYTGGELVKVERQLKQHCVERILEKVSGLNDNVYIQGRRDEALKWKYDDGTDITFFRWNTGEPSNGTIETYLVIIEDIFLWNDHAEDSDFVHAAVCQQK